MNAFSAAFESLTASDSARPINSRSPATSWIALPGAARLYVTLVTAAGLFVFAASFPAAVPRPIAFAVLLATACVTSSWKVTLPLSLNSGSTLSVSYAADLAALLMLGPEQAMVIAVAGAWTQCTVNVRRPYPLYRTVFSMAAEAITIRAAGIAYAWVGSGQALTDLATLARPLVATIATYFVVNTWLVAMAIALSTRQRPWRIWRDNFLWSCPSFMVAGGAGALGAVVFNRDDQWLAILLLAPVYLTYWTYHVFLARIEDQRRHVEETERLHSEALDALLQARRAEQALAEESERLNVTLQSVGDGVITTDLNGTVLLMNTVGEKLTGWPRHEAVGKRFEEVFRNLDPGTREPCDNSIASVLDAADERLSRCTVLVARDRTEHPIEEICAPLSDGSGQPRGMVIAFRDISDALKIQEERAKAATAASLGLLAGGMAHDFNQALIAITGSVAMARLKTRIGPAVRALDDAEEACVQARQLIWHLLTFARGGLPSKKIVPVAPLVQDAATRVLRGTNVTCTLGISADLRDVSADPEQLVQLLTNVIANAHQAMPHAGSIRIDAYNIVESEKRWISALPVEPGEYVCISIVDEGDGIPEEHIARVFDPYFSTREGHPGLGLATAHSIVKNHGGGISVASRPGVGTTVMILLPALVDCERLVDVGAAEAFDNRVWTIH